MKKIISFLFLSFAFTGCTQAKQLTHLDQLLTLKDVSENRDEQIKLVEEHDKKFEKLLAVMKADRLKEYPNKRTILKEFGEPILSKPVVDNGVAQERWLYRYATKYFKSDKVYLYFDDKGNLSHWEHIAAPTTEKVASQ